YTSVLPTVCAAATSRLCSARSWCNSSRQDGLVWLGLKAKPRTAKKVTSMGFLRSSFAGGDYRVVIEDFKRHIRCHDCRELLAHLRRARTSSWQTKRSDGASWPATSRTVLAAVARVARCFGFGSGDRSCIAEPPGFLTEPGGRHNEVQDEARGTE